jgi:hypothetical protein
MLELDGVWETKNWTFERYVGDDIGFSYIGIRARMNNTEKDTYQKTNINLAISFIDDG